MGHLRCLPPGRWRQFSEAVQLVRDLQSMDLRSMLARHGKAGAGDGETSDLGLANPAAGDSRLIRGLFQHQHPRFQISNPVNKIKLQLLRPLDHVIDLSFQPAVQLRILVGHEFRIDRKTKGPSFSGLKLRDRYPR